MKKSHRRPNATLVEATHVLWMRGYSPRSIASKLRPYGVRVSSTTVEKWLCAIFDHYQPRRREPAELDQLNQGLYVLSGGRFGGG